MATQWISPTWRMPKNSNQSKVDNYSLEFNGTDEYIDLGNVLDNVFTSSNFTVSTWIYSTGNTSYDNFFNKGTTVQFYLFSNKIQIYLHPSGIGIWPLESTATLSLNTWYNIVFTRSGNENKLYINGALDNSATSTGSISSSTGSLTFSSVNGGSNYFWQGELSEYSIFDSALTSDQVTALYNSGTPVNPMALTPLPVAYYPLGGSSTGSASTLTVPNQAVPSATVFDFDSSSSQYVDLNSIDLGTTNTISFWHKRGDTTSNQHVLGSPDGTQTYIIYFTSGYIYIRPDGSTQFLSPYLANTPYPFPPYKNTTDWANYIVTRNGDTIKLYLNGVEFALSGSGTGMAATTINAIANKGVGVTATLDGEMSNMVIWNSDQTAEISNIYNSGVPAASYTNTPTAWWKMNVDNANWEADTSGDWQIADANSAYPQCFNLNLADDINFSPGLLNNLSEFTISFWYNRNTANNWPSYSTILTQAGLLDIGQYRYENNNAGIAVSLTTANGTFTIPSTSSGRVYLGEWILVTIVYDGTNLISYRNGELAAGTNTVSATGNTISNSNNFKATSISSFGLEYFISNIQVWDSALPATGTDSVETLYNNGSPLTTAIASSNLKAWYKLDNSATFSTNWSVPDASGNGNTGTSSGMTEQNLVNNNVSALNGESSGMTSANLVTSDLTRSIPYSSYSMEFDGADDEVAFASASSGPLNDIGTGDFTVSVWGNATTKADYGTLIGNWSTNGLIMWRVATSNVFQCYIGGDSFTTTYTIPFDDTWHHYLIKRSGTDVTVYVDGVSVATGTSSATLASSAISYIGNQPHNARRWSGKISNPSIYNYAFSENQVLTVYNGGVPNNISSLSPISWWSLAGDSYYDGTNWICPDLGSGGNNGTSANMAGTELVGDGPGSSANGVATSMDIPTNLKGDAPNSTSNAISINMTAVDRVTSVPG